MDKTGTLTLNRMSGSAIAAGSEVVDVATGVTVGAQDGRRGRDLHEAVVDAVRCSRTCALAMPHARDLLVVIAAGTVSLVWMEVVKCLFRTAP